MPDSVHLPPVNKPPVPTMTNASVIPPLEQGPAIDPRFAPELAEDIVAKPMILPDFVNVPLANPGLAARWIFTDRRRFAQAKAQGWRVAQKRDVKPGYQSLTPFEEEGGTKYINGDLILMVIDRKIYLGALKYKHQVAAALSDAAVQRRLAAGKAVNEMGTVVAAVNRQRAAQGADPVMTVFAPGVADLNDTVLGQPGVAAKEAGRLGNDGPRDTGTLAELAKTAQAERPTDSTST
jgi:hypothetical protein